MLLGLVATGAFVLALMAFSRANAARAEADRLRDDLRALNDWVTRYWRETSAPAPAPSAKPENEPVGGGQPPSAVPVPVVEEPAWTAEAAVLHQTEPEPKPEVPPIPVAAMEKPPRPPFDWESLIGVKLFSWIGGIAFTLAAIYFLKYSVEQHWLSPTIRASLGIITGVALLLVCELRIARDYKFTVNALDGAGIAILYATLFAIHALWHLLPEAVVFGLMLIVTAVAVALSIRRDSIFIALLGLLGGFSTPALLATGENKPIALFSYLLLLNIGLAWVATTRRWPVLTAITVIFTAIYQWAWIAKFMTAAQLPLAAGIFVVFGAAAAASLWVGRRADGNQPKFDTAALAGACLPLLFALVAAAVPGYAARYTVLFTFLLLITIGLSVIAVVRGPHWLHLVGGATTVLVFVIWTAGSYTSRAWPAILGWIAAFVIAQLVATHFAKRPDLAIAPLLFFMFPALAAIEPATASPLLLFATLFMLFGCIAAYAIIHDAPVLYFIAAFLTVAAEGIWSSRHLTPERLLSGLSLYGVFALFFLAVPLIARRFGRTFATGRAATFLLLAVIALMFFLASGPIAAVALWGLAILLGVVNAGAIFEARTARNPLFAIGGILLSWVVLAVWCSTALAVTNLIPALAVMGAFALLVIGGNTWAARRSEEFGHSVYLGLAGHLFLIAVASQKSLAIPPWPLFAVMLVLDLAIGIAAIYLKRDRLMVAALAGSQVMLMVWAQNANVAPWANIALATTIVVAALGLAWFAIDRVYAVAAAVALFAAGIVAMIAGGVSAAPLFLTLLATHLAIVIALLVVAWLTEWHIIAVLAVPLSAIATAVARTHGFAQELVFASVLYAPFVIYPLALGTRTKRAMAPYLAAVLASVPFFVFARHAIREAALDYAIGVLPLFQALLMIALLMRLRRIEPPTERTLNRLALVAAAALAFVTVAIPLQLEKQWITIAWALEAAALVWLFTRIPHRGLLVWSGGLFAAVFVRLTFNRAVFAYHPVSHTPIVNWYLYTYLVAAAAFFYASRKLPKEGRPIWAVPALSSCGTILLFFLVNIEIADFYSKGSALTFNFFSSSLAQDLTYTILWALFAIAMLIAGLILQTRAARVAAIILLLLTVLKCFLHDLARLGGLYRVGSLLGLALSLVLVGVLLQKFVLKTAVRVAAAEELPS
jgi:hypothetical protein